MRGYGNQQPSLYIFLICNAKEGIGRFNDYPVREYRGSPREAL